MTLLRLDRIDKKVFKRSFKTTELIQNAYAAKATKFLTHIHIYTYIHINMFCVYVHMNICVNCIDMHSCIAIYRHIHTIHTIIFFFYSNIKGYSLLFSVGLVWTLELSAST